MVDEAAKKSQLEQVGGVRGAKEHRQSGDIPANDSIINNNNNDQADKNHRQQRRNDRAQVQSDCSGEFSGTGEAPTREKGQSKEEILFTAAGNGASTPEFNSTSSIEENENENESANGRQVSPGQVICSPSVSEQPVSRPGTHSEFATDGEDKQLDIPHNSSQSEKIPLEVANLVAEELTATATTTATSSAAEIIDQQPSRNLELAARAEAVESPPSSSVVIECSENPTQIGEMRPTGERPTEGSVGEVADRSRIEHELPKATAKIKHQIANDLRQVTPNTNKQPLLFPIVRQQQTTNNFQIPTTTTTSTSASLSELRPHSAGLTTGEPEVVKTNNNINHNHNNNNHQQHTNNFNQNDIYNKGRRVSYLQGLLLRSLNDCSGAMSFHSTASGSGSGIEPLDVAALSPANGIEGRSFGWLNGPEVGASAGQVAADSNQAQQQFQRLPSSVWPIHYELFVQPFIAEPFNFLGKVAIRIRCTEPTDNITLHSHELGIDEKSLTLKLAPQEDGQQRSAGNQSAPKIERLSSNKQLQHLIVHLSAKLEPASEYVLSMDFSGVLNDDLAGFYRIRYEQRNSSQPTWVAATQFQATDARRAFPCFDEPLYKATFGIQIKHWKNMTALSNMPIIDRKDSGDGLWVTDTFSRSHKMSTYLVAYAVTNFESRSEGIITVWTRPGFIESANYALRIAGRILRHYEQFFGIEYPLPKMDMIALPDFNAGAMENWGLITYRETAMLYDESGLSSLLNKQRVAMVVAHELAHQWFGNLVTPKWWDDLWLNEGFASYVEYIGVDHVEPAWQMHDQFVVDEIQNVLETDGLPSTHQISIPVNNPDEISEIFDHISYAKGASIIRMMNHFLTEATLKAGLRRYLRALRYSNAEQSDLWAHLTAAANEGVDSGAGSRALDVQRVMNSWTLQTGYPLVEVRRDYSTGSPSIRLSQVRYRPSLRTTGLAGSKLEPNNSSEVSQRWEIPISYTWKSEAKWEPSTRLWMSQDDKDGAAIISEPSQVPQKADEWLLVNIDQVGYFRVNYDLQNWRLLVEQLNRNHSLIKNTNRAQILDDIFELAKGGLLDYRFAMEATRYLKLEHDYLPWETVLLSFAYIDEMLQRSPIYGDWKSYTADLIEPFYGRYRDSEWTLPVASPALTRPRLIQRSPSQVSSNSSSLGPFRGTSSQTGSQPNNNVLEQYNLVNAVSWASKVLPHSIERARSLFARWRQSGRNDIIPALRYTVYCTAIENGDQLDWDFLWAAYEREQNPSERDRMMKALSCTRQVWLLSRYLEWIFDKSKPIRRQDGVSVFKMVAKSIYGHQVAFNFMRERWPTIKEYYGKASFSFGNLIRSVTTLMNTQTELNELLTFYETIKADVGSGKRSFQIAIEEVESNVAWMNKNYKILQQWLQEQQLAKVASTTGSNSNANPQLAMVR